MAKWQYKLNLCHFYHNEELSIGDKAKKMQEAIEKLVKRMQKSSDEDIQEYAREIEEVAEGYKYFDEEEDGVEGFDNFMYELYNIADTPLDENWGGKKLLWVETN